MACHHRILRRTGGLVLAAMVLTGCARGAPAQSIGTSAGAGTFQVEPIVSGLDRPTYVGAAPGDPEALWVLEQSGRVLRLVGEERSVVLDLSEAVRTGAEQGLLGIAFHPRFATNRRLFLHWSDLNGDTRVAEFRGEDDGRSVEPEPVRELLVVDQPEDNHNGGQLAFGPDGRLYLGLGDGGGAFDPQRRAQDLSSPLGKLVALDVDAPEVGWDVVLSGLRNPWRFSFDPALAELWVADVGQDEVEEVNRVRFEPDAVPKNLGWSAYEGNRRLAGPEPKGGGELVFPVVTYPHDAGACSVIGGFIYGGARFPHLVRRYLYGDFCSGALWTLAPTPDGGVASVRQEDATVPQLTHIGQDAQGEIVLSSASGVIYRAVAPGESGPS